jgi:hypothetical protein
VLIAHPTSGKVVEYDGEGQPVWEAKVAWPHSPKRLPNGNTRVAMFNPGFGDWKNERNLVELDRAGKIVWKVAVALPGPETHLPNGHTLLINHLYDPSGKPAGGKLLEFDRAGRIVWEYEAKGNLVRARRR